MTTAVVLKNIANESSLLGNLQDTIRTLREDTQEVDEASLVLQEAFVTLRQQIAEFNSSVLTYQSTLNQLQAKYLNRE